MLNDAQRAVLTDAEQLWVHEIESAPSYDVDSTLVLTLLAALADERIALLAAVQRVADLQTACDFLVVQLVDRGKCYTLPDGECYGVGCMHSADQPDPPAPRSRGAVSQPATSTPTKKGDHR